MDSFAAIIEAFGIGETASALGIDESHVRTMKARDNIPPRYFKRLVDADAALDEPKGITFDLLFDLHDGKRAPAAAGAAA